ncbi:hypothetical protein [Micromonospora sp. NPDC051296]
MPTPRTPRCGRCGVAGWTGSRGPVPRHGCCCGRSTTAT